MRRRQVAAIGSIMRAMICVGGFGLVAIERRDQGEDRRQHCKRRR
jgi:hypothetical protein